eukprot:5085919-Amphidinium_carterae.1
MVDPAGSPRSPPQHAAPHALSTMDAVGLPQSMMDLAKSRHAVSEAACPAPDELELWRSEIRKHLVAAKEA